MKRNIYAIVAISLLAAVCLLWFIFDSSTLRQYEVISKDDLYRACISNIDSFINVEAKVSPAYILMGVHDNEGKSEPWNSVTLYAYRNHIRIANFIISPDGSVADDQIDMALKVAQGKRRPVLVISADGAPAGMVAAAYRLRVEKMPLDQVEKLAQLPDAPADTTRRIREFARAYDKTLRAASAGAGIAGAAADQAPATAPTTSTPTN